MRIHESSPFLVPQQGVAIGQQCSASHGMTGHDVHNNKFRRWHTSRGFKRVATLGDRMRRVEHMLMVCVLFENWDGKGRILI